MHKLTGLMPRALVLRIKYFKHVLYRIINHKELVSTNYHLDFISKEKTHVFFGYYDISPFNKKTDEIVYLNLQEHSNKVIIVSSNLSNLKNERIIADSSAWSWQQGIRLRWMPDNDREIIFNDFVDDKYIARIINVDNAQERRFDAPLYDVSPDGKYGLSIDFERLESKRAGYGYSCRLYSEENRDLRKEGIDLLNIENNTLERILTYETIAKACGTEEIDYKKAYINHIAFSPSGKKFLFFWINIDGGKHRASLVVYDFISRMITPLETEEIVSHYVWENDEKIICTAFNSSSKCSYYTYSVSDGKKEIMNRENLTEDGHPSIYNECEILTDTYPNLNGYQTLFIAGKNNGKRELLSIYSTCLKEDYLRTDLHPRINKEKSIVCFDANQKGFRSLYFLYLSHGNKKFNNALQ